MIHVVSHWEIGWNTPLLEADLWLLPLRDFGVKDWWIWPVSGIRSREARVNIEERHDLREILEEVPDWKRVFFEPRNPSQFNGPSVDLPKYRHGENAIWIFGSNHFCPPMQVGREEDDYVTVPTFENSGVLWPHQVFTVAAHDRLVKSWQ